MVKKKQPKQYEVEKIMDRRGRGDAMEYLIKWKGMIWYYLYVIVL